MLKDANSDAIHPKIKIVANEIKMFIQLKITG
jgi:hypothetical protein